MTTLLKLGGAVCTAPATLDELADAWIKRARPTTTWIVVHGGGPQLDAALIAVDGPPVKVDGLRITSEKAAGIVQQVLDNIGREMTTGLAARGVPVQHIASTQKRLHAVIKDSRIPLGRVGSATHFDTKDLPNGILVVSPVGFDAMGPLNVNADEAALAVARSLGVDRLVLATDVPHVRDAEGKPVATTDVAGVHKLLSSGAANGGMVPKLHNALQAVESGVYEAIIGTLAAAWDGSGTHIFAATPTPKVHA